MKMFKLFGVVLFIFLFLLSYFAVASEDNQNDCLYYFYGQGCETCSSTTAFIDQLNIKYPELNLNKFEVYYDLENYALLNQYFNAYNLNEDSQKIPVVITSGSYFVGEKIIEDFLEESIQLNSDNSCPTLENNNMIGVVGEGSSKHPFSLLTFFNVTSSAFLNAFSPVFLMFLTLLLILFITFESKKDFLKKSFVFLGIVYLVYLFFGLGLFLKISTLSFISIFYRIIAFFALIYSLFMIVNFLKSSQSSLKNFNSSLMKRFRGLIKFKTSFLGVSLIAFCISILSLTKMENQFYLLQSLFIHDIQRGLVFLFLIYYLLVLMLVLLIFVFVLYLIKEKLLIKAKHINDEKKSLQFKNYYFKLLNLAVSLFILILSLVVIFI